MLNASVIEDIFLLLKHKIFSHSYYNFGGSLECHLKIRCFFETDFRSDKFTKRPVYR